MADFPGRAWRLTAAALCFASFGIGAILLGWIVFPLLHLVVRDRRSRASHARTIIRHAFRALIGAMRLARLVTVEIRGEHFLQRRGLLILANHPTLIDVVFLLAIVRQADCVVKAALAANPFTRGPIRAAAFVFNDSGPGLLDACVESVRAGNNLIVFPEGTRTPASGVLHLRRGAARIALLGGLDILPIRIGCTPQVLGKHDKWYAVATRRVHFCISVGEPIATAPFIRQSHPALAARRLTDHLTAYFAPETSRADR